MEKRFCKKNNQAGLTLVEVLVTIFLFGVSLTAISYIINYNVITADDLLNDSIASGLLQEGVEVARNLRDADWFAGRPFGAFGTASAAPDGTYLIQWDSQSLTAFSDIFLKKDPANGLYGYTTGNATIFKRTVQVSTIPAIPAIEKIITVSVTWRARSGTKSVNAEEHLFNWR